MRQNFWAGVVIGAVISAVIGLALIKIMEPARGLWIDVFGSPEQKASKEYQDHKSKISKEDSVQVALSWKAEQDSLKQVKRREAVQCIKREIDRGKENPCVSSIYYYHIDYYTDIGIDYSIALGELGELGELDLSVNWFIGSTECPQMFLIFGHPKTMPAASSSRKWIKRYFATPIVREAEIARIFGRCQ